MQKINSIITKTTAGAWLKMGVIDYKQWATMCNPEYARFKAVVYWRNTGFKKPFFSLEGEHNGNEEKGFNDLYRRIVYKFDPNLYNSITVFMNDTDDLRTSEKNYNYEISCYCAGHPIRTERKVIFNQFGKVDIEATKKINTCHLPSVK